MKQQETITVRALYDIEADSYVTYDRSNGFSVVRNPENRELMYPKGIINTNIDPNLFSYDYIEADNRILNDDQIVERILSNNDMPREEWDAKTDDEKEEMIVDYSIDMMNYEEYRRNDVREEMLTFTVEYEEDEEYSIFHEYKGEEDNFDAGRDSYYGWCMNGGGGRKEFRKMYGNGNFTDFVTWLLHNDYGKVVDVSIENI